MEDIYLFIQKQKLELQSMKSITLLKFSKKKADFIHVCADVEIYHSKILFAVLFIIESQHLRQFDKAFKSSEVTKEKVICIQVYNKLNFKELYKDLE